MKKLIFIFILLSLLVPISGNSETSKNIIEVFRNYTKLNSEFVEAVRNKSSRNHLYNEHRLKVESYAEDVFNPILKEAKRKVCNDKDIQVLNEYFEVIVNTTNSADEYPSFVLGEMFICDPDLFLEQYKKLRNDKKGIIYDTLEWGFKNVTWNKEDKIPNLNKLKTILDSLKNKNK